MGIASIILGIVALICALVGAFVSIIPGVGTFASAFLSLAAPVIALIGIVLGGVGMSRAREEGAPSGVALGGLIVSIIAFVPALLVALTCGVCNSLCAAAMVDGRFNARDAGPLWTYDAGPSTYPTIPDEPPPQGDIAPTVPGQPPPAYPPPPIPGEAPTDTPPGEAPSGAPPAQPPPPGTAPTP